MGVDGLAWGVGYGESENGTQASTKAHGPLEDDSHMTVFANYSMGAVTLVTKCLT